MKTNFNIIDNHAVSLNGIHIDLHNNFKFKEISKLERDMKIEFTQSKGDWVHENEFKHLIFLHKNVSYSKIDSGNNSEYPEDENILSTITFFSNSIRETNDAFMTHSKSKDDDDIIYFFENKKMFRLSCESIELIVNK